MTDEEIIKGLDLACSSITGSFMWTANPFPILRDYIHRLQSENAALRERLEKAVEHGKYFIMEEPRNGKIYYSILRHKVINNYICTELTRAEAEARLAELKGEKE